MLELLLFAEVSQAAVIRMMRMMMMMKLSPVMGLCLSCWKTFHLLSINVLILKRKGALE